MKNVLLYILIKKKNWFSFNIKKNFGFFLFLFFPQKLKYNNHAIHFLTAFIINNLVKMISSLRNAFCGYPDPLKFSNIKKNIGFFLFLFFPQKLKYCFNRRIIYIYLLICLGFCFNRRINWNLFLCLFGLLFQPSHQLISFLFLYWLMFQPSHHWNLFLILIWLLFQPSHQHWKFTK